VVGVFNGVLGVAGKGGKGDSRPLRAAPKQTGPAKTAKAAKNSKAPTRRWIDPAGFTGADRRTNRRHSDADIDRIKSELKLDAGSGKALDRVQQREIHYLGHNGADRLNLRIARAKRDPPTTSSSDAYEASSNGSRRGST